MIPTQAMKRASKQNFGCGVLTTFCGAVSLGYLLVQWVHGERFLLLDFSFVAAQGTGLVITGISSLIASQEILRNRIRPYGWVKSLAGMLLFLYGMLGKGLHDGTFPTGFLIALAAFMVIFTGLLFVAIHLQAKQKAEVKLDK